jgi:hypothetical protein
MEPGSVIGESKPSMSSKTKLLLSPEMAGPHKVGISSAIPTDEIGV